MGQTTSTMETANSSTLECLIQKEIQRETHGKTPEPDGYTALHEAARIGDVSVIKVLLKAGDNVNATNLDKKTPLMLALQSDHLEAAAYLLDGGADLEARGFEDRTALLVSARSSIYSVNFLLDRGANVEAKDIFGKSALMIAVSCGRFDIAQLLLDQGANTEARDDKGRTALHLAAEVSAFNQIDLILLLLYKGAYIEAQDYKGRTPLLAAVNSGVTFVALKLIIYGANFQATDVFGQTALMGASHDPMGEGLGLTRILIAAGANIEARDAYGRTAFGIAKIAKSKASMLVLFSSGANVHFVV